MIWSQTNVGCVASGVMRVWDEVFVQTVKFDQFIIIVLNIHLYDNRLVIRLWQNMFKVTVCVANEWTDFQWHTLISQSIRKGYETETPQSRSETETELKKREAEDFKKYSVYAVFQSHFYGTLGKNLLVYTVLRIKYCYKSCAPYITKTCLYNIDRLKPHYYIAKLGFTGVYIIFLISAQKHRLWVLVRTASPRRFKQVPTIYVLSRNMKNFRIFIWKFSFFGGKIFSIFE